MASFRFRSSAHDYMCACVLRAIVSNYINSKLHVVTSTGYHKMSSTDEKLNELMKLVSTLCDNLQATQRHLDDILK